MNEQIQLPLIDQAAKLMCEVAFPTLIDEMKNVGVQEIVLKQKSFCEVHLQVSGRMFFIDEANGNAESLLSANILEEKTDDQKGMTKSFEKVRNTYATPTDIYTTWCCLIMDKIEELKKNRYKIENVIDRLNKIPLICTRKTLIEKVVEI